MLVDRKTLKQAERAFLLEYPGGFEHPELAALAKKHKMDQHEAFARQSFARARFDDPPAVLADMATLVSRSGMVSMFEKPEFKAMASELSKRDTRALTEGLYELLHGAQKSGFEGLVAALAKHKLAKWTLVSVVPAYYRPRNEVFVKPSTAKLIVDKLDLGLSYRATPTWPFYRDFRKAINSMRGSVDPRVAPNNPAFCGFLMMQLRD